MGKEMYYLFEEWTDYDSGGMHFHSFETKDELMSYLINEYDKTVERYLNSDDCNLEDKKIAIDGLQENFMADAYIIKGKRFKIEMNEFRFVTNMGIKEE